MKRARDEPCDNGEETGPLQTASNEAEKQKFKPICIEYIEKGAEWEQNVNSTGNKLVSVGFGTKVRNGKKVRCEMKIPLRVVREFNQLHRDLYSQFVFLEHEREQFALEAGSYFNSRDREYDFISRALACVYTNAVHTKMHAPLLVLAKIGETSYCKYKNLLEQENANLSCDSIVFKLRGSQVKYEAKNDAAFMRWLKDSSTSLKKKTTEMMMQEYDRISGSEYKVTRQHICFLLHRNGWRMVRPNGLDVERCIDYEVLDLWFQNPRIRELLCSVDKRLFFNADETDLNRKGGAPRWVASEGGARVTYVTKDHSGSHVSLFLVVSAGGKPMYPFALLHGPPDKFVEEYDDSLVRCYRTKKGYMELATFDRIMRTLFVPYVKSQRELYGLPSNAPAVLVVDGHGSRYNPSTLKYLRDNHVHLVVIPAHSSHILQPLDLTLNHLVKDRYKKEYSLAESHLLKLKKRKKEEETGVTEGEEPNPDVVIGDDDETIPKPQPKRRSMAKRTKHGRQNKRTKPKRKPKKEQGVSGSKKKQGCDSKATETKPQCADTPASTPEKEQENSGFTLAERRWIMVQAAVDSVMGALIHRSIESAWAASGLHPLLEHPPYTQEKAEDLKKQALEMGENPMHKKRVVHLTGVLTDDDAIKDIEALIAKRKKVTGKPYRYKRVIMTSLGRREKLYEVCASLADVGEYAVLDDNDPVPGDNGTLMGDTMASAQPDATPTQTLSQFETAQLAAALAQAPRQTVRRRGRPRKKQPQETLTQADIVSFLKQHQPDAITRLNMTALVESMKQTICVPHRGRGRPKKNPVNETPKTTPSKQRQPGKRRGTR